MKLEHIATGINGKSSIFVPFAASSNYSKDSGMMCMIATAKNIPAEKELEIPIKV